MLTAAFALVLALAPGAAAEAPESGGTDRHVVIDIGDTRNMVSGSLGANVLLKHRDVGTIGLFRWKRFTNFTFADLQLQGYLIPTGADAGRLLQTYGLARFKISERFFSHPSSYGFSTYQVKTSTAEDLALRAMVESGYGAFLADRGSEARHVSINAEIAAVFDYANLDAYKNGVSTGYGKLALESDFSFHAVSGKLLGQIYQELVNANPGAVGNQTHMDIEALVHVRLTTHFRISGGVLHTWFLLLDKDRFGQPVWTLTSFLALTAVGGP